MPEHRIALAVATIIGCVPACSLRRKSLRDGPRRTGNVLLRFLVFTTMATFSSSCASKKVSSHWGGVKPSIQEASPVVVEIAHANSEIADAAGHAVRSALVQSGYVPADPDALQRARSQFGLLNEGFMSARDRQRFGDVQTWGTWITVKVLALHSREIPNPFRMNNMPLSTTVWDTTMTLEWSKRDGTVYWTQKGTCTAASSADEAINSAVEEAMRLEPVATIEEETPPPQSEANPVVVEVRTTCSGNSNTDALVVAATSAITQALLQRRYALADADEVRRARSRLGLKNEGFMSEENRGRFASLTKYGSWLKLDVTSVRKEYVRRLAEGESRIVDAWYSAVSCSWERRDGAVVWSGTGKCDRAKDVETAIRDALEEALGPTAASRPAQLGEVLARTGGGKGEHPRPVAANPVAITIRCSEAFAKEAATSAAAAWLLARGYQAKHGEEVDRKAADHGLKEGDDATADWAGFLLDAGCGSGLEIAVSRCSVRRADDVGRNRVWVDLSARWLTVDRMIAWSGSGTCPDASSVEVAMESAIGAAMSTR